MEDEDKQVETQDKKGWEKAHQKFQQGENELMHRMLDQVSARHALELLNKSDGPFTKKGKKINYDETDSFLAGASLLSLTFLLHPLLLTAWLTAFYKIVQHSVEECKHAEDRLTMIDKFGFELHYFIGGSMLVAYYFTQIQGQTIDLQNAGTMAQILLESIKLIGM